MTHTGLTTQLEFGNSGMSTSGGFATLLGAELVGPEHLELDGIESIDNAGPRDLTFITSAAYAAKWAASAGGVAIVTRGIDVPEYDASTRALLLVTDAEQSMIDALEHVASATPPPRVGIDATASIDASATIGAGACIGPHVSVGPDTVLGADVVIEAGVRIGHGARIGDSCRIGANVVIGSRCVLGDRCQLHAMVCLGADGFGYRPRPDGQGLRKVPHVGTVILGDDVELGAGTCVDRGKFGATSIGSGTKIDNLVQIAHNVQIGSNCVIAAQAGFGGSVIIGDWVQIGAQVGIAEHIEVGDGVKVGGRSGLIKNVPSGSAVMGFPAEDRRIILRQWACIRKLPQLMADVRSQSGREDGV
jgi:UDP-3-O-[3-hydroxymyristoyl] glucosamine N-acyltransferase